ncbi:S-layer homology domain-containing protein [Lysinibacillus endophyticus]|uniref:S-layer homology domain-containing protein n=1 Tax=Ureibacillus endophyticus TaxID=1978490 RepID=UPI003137685A
MKKNNTYKKFFNITMATAVAASGVTMVAPIETKANTSFTDVSTNNGFYKEIMNLAERGIIKGYQDGTFRPGVNVTRGQAAKIIAGVLGLDTMNVSNPGFKDVPKTNEYYGAIAALANAGIINGYGDGTFKPNEPVKRNHMAKIIAGAFKLNATSGYITPLKDIRGEYEGYITALYEYGVTTGKTKTTFDGISNVSRGQLAAFVVRAENIVVEKEESLSLTISEISNTVRTTDNTTYTVSSDLKALLNEKNSAALENAKLEAIVKDNKIIRIDGIELNSDGSQDALVTLDGQKSTFTGNLTVNADYVELKNLTVNGNVILTGKVVNEFSANGLNTTGELIIQEAEQVALASLKPIVANTKNGLNISLQNSTVSKVNAQRDNSAIHSDTKLPEIVVSAKVTTIQVDADVLKFIVAVEVSITVTGTGEIDELAIEKAKAIALQVAGEVAKLNVGDTTAKVDVGVNLKIETVVVPEGSQVSSIISNYDAVKNNIIKVETPSGQDVSTTIPTPSPNTNGSSDNSTNPSTPSIVVGQLMGLQAIEGDGSVSLKWNPSSNATKYYIDVYLGSKTSNWNEGRLENLSTSTNNTGITINGLTNGQEYTFKVYGANENGTTPIWGGYDVKITKPLNPTAQTDKEAADAVTAKINALPEVNNLTLANETAVNEAQTAYEGLTEAQKALVSEENKAKLTSALEKIAELKEAQTDEEAANAVTEKINALPEVNALTLENETAVNEAQTAYEGLTEVQKALVSEANKTKLTSALEKIAELKEAQTDEEAANAVTAKINALPEVNALTLENETAVNEAQTAYEGLTEAQKALVSEENKAKLTSALEKIAELKEAQTDKEAADAVTAKINALPEVNNLTLANETAVNEAQTAYEGLTEAQKALVSEANKTKLTSALEKIADLKAADAVTAKINALPEVNNLTLANETAVNEAQTAYEGLTEAQKALVSEANKTKLTSALEKIADLKAATQTDKEAADAVTAKINALPEVNNLTLANETAVNEAQTAYEGLTEAQKALVSEENKAKLTSALEKIAELKEAQTDKEAADAVTAKINALPEVNNLTLANETAVNEAQTAYEGLTEAQKALVSEANKTKLTSALEKIADLKAATQTDKEAADVVTAKINALPDVNNLTLANETAVNEAQTAYEGLTEAQKALVSEENKAKLTSALEKIAELKEAQTDKEAANAVTAKINALPEVNNLTLANETAVNEAQTAYEGLTEAQKALVSEANKTKLTSALEKIADLKAATQTDKEAADAVTAKINALPDVNNLTLANETAVNEAQTAYEGLTEAQKALVSEENKAKLTSALEKIAELKEAQTDKEAADVVTAKINALPEVNNLSLANETAVNEAQTAYEGLTEAQKALVSEANKTKLTNAVAKIASLITVIVDPTSIGGTAGDGKITGLKAGTKYVVTVDGRKYGVQANGTLGAENSAAQELTGTEITGLTNGKTYIVEILPISYIISSNLNTSLEVSFSESVGSQGQIFDITGTAMEGATIAATLNSEDGTILTITVTDGVVPDQGTIILPLTIYGQQKQVTFIWDATSGSWNLTGEEFILLNEPKNLQIESGNHSATLKWDVVNGATGYNIYRSNTENGPFTLIESNVNATTFKDTTLGYAQAYYYYVEAVNGNIKSLKSDTLKIISNLDQQGPIYNGDFVVISNNSTNATMTQTTGTLPNPMVALSMSAGSGSKDYRENPLIPFNPIDEPGFAKSQNIMNDQQDEIVYTEGSEKSFKVTDMRSSNTTYSINAVLLSDGDKSQVWVHNGAISEADAKKISNEFDTNIYPKVVGSFGNPSDVNNDGKIAILCFDIQDSYTTYGSGGYTGGYFSGNDLFEQFVDKYNYMDIIYIDTYPTMGSNKEGTPDVTKAYSTLAHEFQHLINFNQDIIERNVYTNSTNPRMETWLNEGLSMAAETLVYGQSVNKDRVDYYNDPRYSGIRNGHSLLYWDNNGETLANYSLSFLFVQYLKIQAGQGDSIFKEIIEYEKGNYEAVEAIIKKYIDEDMSFGDFMTAFRIALVLKEDTGLYGFKGDPILNQIQTQFSTGGTKNLQGGGAIVVKPTEAGLDSTGKGENIDYTGVYTIK